MGNGFGMLNVNFFLIRRSSLREEVSITLKTRVSLLVMEILFMYFVLLANVLSKIGMPLRLSWLHEYVIRMPKAHSFKCVLRGWENGSVVKNTRLSFKRPEFIS